MKTIYFVRHGECDQNVNGFYEGADSPLTKKGEEQAEYIARRCDNLEFDHIIASTMKRASDTAAKIVEHTQKPIEHSDLFVERRRPSEQLGLARESEEFLAIEKELIANFETKGYRYSDEENFDDIVGRARDALRYLEEHESNNILVVSHGLFLRILLAEIVFKDMLTPEFCDRIIPTFDMENTGLSVFTHNPHVTRSKWKVQVWNDYAHLG